MDRCELAFNYRKEKFNCAQAVAAPFADLLGTTPEELASAMSGFGGGLGGCHEEVCGAVSGGVYVLSRLHADPADRGGHKTVYPKAKEFRRRIRSWLPPAHPVSSPANPRRGPPPPGHSCIFPCDS